MLRIAGAFIFIGLLMFWVFNRAEWYSEDVLLPRFCDNTERHLKLVKKILSDKKPAGDEARRPYIIAAKLIYIIPRNESEPIQLYIERLRKRIQNSCR